MSKFKSIYDNNYKNLMDITGKGWSVRLKSLLLLKSVVFIF